MGTAYQLASSQGKGDLGSMQVRIPAVYMRGGTSKGLFFHKDHLPVDPTLSDRVILAAYGSPDPVAGDSWTGLEAEAL